jgi:hypothetical protein
LFHPDPDKATVARVKLNVKRNGGNNRKRKNKPNQWGSEEANFLMTDLADDAVTRYVNKLPLGARLKYYQLSKGERFVLQAMLDCSRDTGELIFATKETLAELAGVDEKTVHNAIHGYKRKDGTRQVGLKDRGILSQLAAPKRGKHKAVTYRINWEAFVIDPQQTGAIEERLQETLPGMKTRPRPDSHHIAPESREQSPQPAGGKAVDPAKREATSPSLIGSRSLPGGQPLPPREATVAPVLKSFTSVSTSLTTNSSSAGSDRGVVQIPAAGSEKAVVREPFSAKPKTSPPRRAAGWATLHPAIRRRIERELELVKEAEVGSWSDYGKTPEQIAAAAGGRVRRACERAKIWPHVTEDLVQVTYELVLEMEEAQGQKPEGEN